MSGQWEGDLKGKHGHFPFTHVSFIDSDQIVDANTTSTALPAFVSS